MSEKNTKRQVVGIALDNKMDKTATIEVERRFSHPVYNKYIVRNKKYYAHDESNSCSCCGRNRFLSAPYHQGDIEREIHIPRQKNHEAERTEMGKSTICRLWRNSTFSHEDALSNPPSCIRHI